jgi:hypothetical protein
MMVGGLNSRRWDKEANKCHFTLPSLVFLYWHRVFSFTLPFFSLALSLAFFAFELSRCAYIPMCSITYFFRTCMCMLCHANSIAVLQCTSSISITITTTIIIIANRIRKNVFTHMRRHAGEEEKKELIFRVYCLCIYMHTKQSHHIMQ